MSARTPERAPIDVLKAALGEDATFRDDQQEAIASLVRRHGRVLVVQRTGWGKSVVYFVATEILRERGAGPTLIISPLLSLMRDQIRMAERFGLRARYLSSANTSDADAIEQELRAGEVDVLFVAPERLANLRFRRDILPGIRGGVGMVVVDEAHCVSDWGHDFRPDYRRIVEIVRALPSTVPVLATTATADDRVVQDVRAQLGSDVEVMRGPLARESLRLQAIGLPTQAERLAWLAERVPALPGSGIVYCLTVPDTILVADWLRQNDVDAAAYYGSLPNEERQQLEERLLRNDVKVLVATVALGMGFDKPDLGFVVHFQRPPSVIAYYQQIGRAGRAVADAPVVLMTGAEDDAIADYFIRSALPTEQEEGQVVEALDDAADGLSRADLARQVNVRMTRLDQVLKILEVDGIVTRDKDHAYHRTVNRWQPNPERAARLAAVRHRDIALMREYTETDQCLMAFVTRALDDPAAADCGRCANCTGTRLPAEADPGLVERARAFTRRRDHVIKPRVKLPAGVYPGLPGAIPADRRVEPGRALCLWGDAGWGALVRQGKYTSDRFDDRLVNAAAELVRERWRPDPPPTWVASVPSLRHPELVVDLARRLAEALGLPYRPALLKTRETPAQKEMENSAQQLANVGKAFAAASGTVLPGPVLLVDDMVDSGWTLAVCGSRLRKAGSGPVFPFALAVTTPGDDA